ncbi:helix-turn-helix domain-containing protein [Hymenobacter sp. 15J16-1T3B]|uniref:helix-turn-helix domain-containing protein n=1 Tax=Hymenobacter sp. 15J16-1T3B TaxID=2886941 RepID=UPI001D105B02|nr:helix-turn-helix transcriptional regulator [Hymenobacter sp. 15J16-1T3B]MCC3160307.1 helix-turn-helix domain-containing protein [Hymenobacter sp. 15J16-1T3B]
MVDRIRQLLQVRQLTPTQFADTIGVARPIVSHILGGRNKPSLEVVQKIIAAFPDVAMPWLLTGQGPMLASGATDQLSRQVERSNGPVKLTDTPARPRATAKSDKASSGAETTRIAAEQKSDAALTELAATPPTPPAALTDAAIATVATGAVVAAAPSLSLEPKPAKTIRRVLIFYSDGTFTDFSPASEGI